MAPDTRPVDAIRFAEMKRVNPEVLKTEIETQPGVPVQTEVLDRDMRRLFGTGDFEHVDYRIVQEGDQRILDIDAVEKAWGPGYVRFGLGFSYDFKGNGLFDIAASYRRTWLNSLGAEWRTDLRLGHNSRLRTGWYQPLATSHYLFVEPYAEARRVALDLYRDDLRVATYNMDRLRVGVDLGTQVTKFGEARLGLAGGTLRPKLESGPAVLDLGAPRIDQAGVSLRRRVRPDRQHQLPALGRVREHRGLRLAPRPRCERQLHPVGLSSRRARPGSPRAPSPSACAAPEAWTTTFRPTTWCSGADSCASRATRRTR